MFYVKSDQFSLFVDSKINKYFRFLKKEYKWVIDKKKLVLCAYIFIEENVL